jgi:hypothetical protein
MLEPEFETVWVMEGQLVLAGIFTKAADAQGHIDELIAKGKTVHPGPIKMTLSAIKSELVKERLGNLQTALEAMEKIYRTIEREPPAHNPFEIWARTAVQQ